MDHKMAVSKAIQAALNDINLLRALVEASNKDAANAILLHYKRNWRHLGLEEPDLEEFWNSLKHGVITIDARTLVEYYYGLVPKSRVRTGGRQIQEWTP